MNKVELQEACEEQEIEFTEEMTKAELQALLDDKEEEAEEEAEEGEKVFLKQKRGHQKGFRIGRHLIVPGPAESYLLNEKEFAELKTAGPQAWVSVVEKIEE